MSVTLIKSLGISVCTPSFHLESSRTQASANTFWDAGGGKRGRGTLTGSYRIGGGPPQKTAGKNETRESEAFSGKNPKRKTQEMRAFLNRKETSS